MSDINVITMTGRLTRDCELKYTQGGSAVCSLPIAVSHVYYSNKEKKEETCFVDVTFFGRTAEVANEYLSKGSQVAITGRLKLNSWDDKTTGKKVYKHEVIGSQLTMLGRGETTASNRPAQQSSPSNTNTDEEDVPF